MSVVGIISVFEGVWVRKPLFFFFFRFPARLFRLESSVFCRVFLLFFFVSSRQIAAIRLHVPQKDVGVFFLHLFLGLPFPALMAVVAFCITLIPLVGSVLYWGIATVVALFTNPITALIFAALYLIYMQLEAYVLTPRVMNRAISVPGSLVVIGALVGGTLLGLLGALVAIPITASILLIIKQVVIPRQDAKL